MINIVEKPITGKESQQKADHPLGALIDFYQAFNTGDMGLMESNWLQTPEASMSNPLGGIKRGWSEIRRVYQNIFKGPAKVYVEFYDYSIYDSGAFFQAVGRERGTLDIGKTTINLHIRTSRSYVRQDGRYHQVHHHGSMDDPALLARYQSAVLQGKTT